MAHKHKWICVDCHETKETASARPRANPKPCYLCKLDLDDGRPLEGWVIPSGRKYAAMPSHQACVRAAEVERDRIWAENHARRFSTFNIATANFCACGHGSLSHRRDELENYLKCSATECACDHFHYQTDSSEAEIAA